MLSQMPLLGYKDRSNSHTACELCYEKKSNAKSLFYSFRLNIIGNIELIVSEM